MTDTSTPPTSTPVPAADSHLDRRRFLRGSAVAAASVVVGSLLQGLTARAAYAAEGRPVRPAGPNGGGYGPLRPTPPAVPVERYPDTQWLALPEGFQYVVFGLAG